MITHVVLIRFPDPDAASVEDLLAPFRALPGVIPGLVSVEAGRNTNPEGLHQGFLHALVMRFTSPADRDAYLPHPAHVRIATPLIAGLARGTQDVVVFDLEGA
ncbi:MAG: Dabb family protein [Pseudomonadota bacterium]